MGVLPLVGDSQVIMIKVI